MGEKGSAVNTADYNIFAFFCQRWHETPLQKKTENPQPVILTSREENNTQMVTLPRDGASSSYQI